jgi:hypothetical protein
VAAVTLSGLLLAPTMGGAAFPAAVALLAANRNPQKRRTILSVLAALVCAASLGAIPIGALASAASGKTAVALTLAVMTAVAALWCWSRYLPRLPAIRHPLALLHGSAVLAVVALGISCRGGALSIEKAALCAALIPELLWRASYWIKWRLRQPGDKGAAENLFTVIPFLGRGGVPYGKGPEYLTRYEASDASERAAAQIRGIGLLLLALAWRLVSALIVARVHGGAQPWFGWSFSPASSPLVPSMSALLDAPLSYPLSLRWAALFSELVQNILTLAAYGHTIVAIYSLAGFCIPRNTSAPLLASTVLDFWARYYFYFKELLMDFFFFPVYLRCSRLPGIARTLVATFAAAFAGNVYYHLFLYAPEWMQAGGRQFGSMALLRCVYCALLAAGLGWSIGRASRRAERRPPWQQAMGILGAAMFFALLHIWNYHEGEASLAERWEVLQSLFMWD